MYSFFIIASASQAQEKAQPVTGWLSQQQEGKKSITLLQYKDYSEYFKCFDKRINHSSRDKSKKREEDP